MSSNPQQLVQKLWNYCNILRDDGLSYGDYVEQLTFLLFLKMADEQSRPPFKKASPIPKGFNWEALLKLDGEYLSLARFFNSVAQLPRVINMENITLSEPSTVDERVILHATVTATTFRALADDERPKPAEDKPKPGAPANNNATPLGRR